jgi:UDP-glucose 4-epimerase
MAPNLPIKPSLPARRFLVTGGAGYIGSHLVALLCARGEQVVVLDNLSTGHRAALPDGVRLVVADLADQVAVDSLLAEGNWDAVFHFAALSQVGASMREPYRYLLDNAMLGTRLIAACVRHGVRRFVLSSTAAVFGSAAVSPIAEDAPIDPGSPYGESKRMLERALYWAGRIDGLHSGVLRYFNAAGADPSGRLGEDHDPETHLIPLAIDAVLGRRPPLRVFGTDYATPDGTCIRDYVHVTDLAEAHMLALDHLAPAGGLGLDWGHDQNHGANRDANRVAGSNVTWNLGTETGHSVLEVLQSVARVAGRPVPHEAAPRRPGDPPMLVASARRIRAEAGWQPRHTALDDIVRTAFAWREAHPDGYGD